MAIARTDVAKLDPAVSLKHHLCVGHLCELAIQQVSAAGRQGELLELEVGLAMGGGVLLSVSLSLSFTLSR